VTTMKEKTKKVRGGVDEPQWAPLPHRRSDVSPRRSRRCPWYLPSPSRIPPPPPLLLSSPPNPPHALSRVSISVHDLQRRLEFSSYEPYLLPTVPVEPTWSFSYGQATVRFLCALSPPELWSSRPTAQIFNPSSFHPDVQRAMESQPDFDYVRRMLPPRRGFKPPKEKGRDYATWMNLREVVRWIWGGRWSNADDWSDTAWAVEALPTPLFALCTLSFLSDLFDQQLIAFLPLRRNSSPLQVVNGRTSATTVSLSSAPGTSALLTFSPLVRHTTSLLMNDKVVFSSSG
jgi:hypothetical protein